MQVDPLPGSNGRDLARLVAFAKELQRDANGQPFRLPVRYGMAFLEIDDLSRVSGLLRQLEKRGFLKCIQRGTATRDGVKGSPTLWRFTGLEDRL